MEISQQQVITCSQKDPPSLITKSPPVINELDKEWETFNEMINLEGQIPKTPTSNTQIAGGVMPIMVSNISEKEHAPITPSLELVLNIEEIPPLEIFYSPQHKAVVRRQRKK